MDKLKKEDRYIVIKKKHLNPTTRVGLRNFLKENEIETIECVVVESKDEALYEKVWTELETRDNE